jgi:hypothetical protein
MAVTLFKDMGEENRIAHHAFDLICDRRRRVRYATLDESHLFV